MAEQEAEYLRDFKESIRQKRNSLHYSERNTHEYHLLDLQFDILRGEVLSADISTLEEVQALSEYLDKKDKRSGERFCSLASSLNLEFNDIFKTYGIPAVSNPLSNLVVRVYKNIDDGEGQPMILPENPSKKEVMGRTLTKIKKDLLLKYGGHTIGVLPGFDNWKAALVFEGYSHCCMQRREIRGRIYYANARRFVVRKNNHQRYISFGFTSEEAVRRVKPGALYVVENKFGKDIASKVNGNRDYFNELLSEINKKR